MTFLFRWMDHIDGLVQERHNSSALAMELRLSFINPSIFVIITLSFELNIDTINKSVKHRIDKIKSLMWSY